MTRAKNIQCVQCDQTKPEDQFVNDRTRTSGKFPWCKACVTAVRKETKKRDAMRALPPAADGDRACQGCLRSLEGMHSNRLYCSLPCKERVRRWKSFGLEPDEYRMLIASNNGTCPICRRNVKRWVLDHNHITGEVTGATCSVCNQSLLAYSRHQIEIANALVEYLISPPLERVFGEKRFVGPETLSQLERAKGWRKARGPYSVGLASPPYVPKKAA